MARRGRKRRLEIESEYWRLVLSVHTPEDLRTVEERLNNRPRKILGWRTPTDVFHAALAE